MLSTGSSGLCFINACSRGNLLLLRDLSEVNLLSTSSLIYKCFIFISFSTGDPQFGITTVLIRKHYMAVLRKSTSWNDRDVFPGVWNLNYYIGYIIVLFWPYDFICLFI